MRTRVRTIDGGPAGLLLSQLLHLNGIDTVPLERRTRDHVLGRIPAGALEPGIVELPREAGVIARMDRNGIRHDGVRITSGHREFRVDFRQRTGEQVMIWGQNRVTEDLIRHA